MSSDRRRAAAALAFSVLLASCVPLRAAAQSDLHDDYALLFGTVYGPDDRPVYGVKITIRRADQKKAKWELVSDHSGEFAQRVPTGAADYFVTADLKTPKGQPKPQITVHIDKNERKEFSVHLK